MKVTTTYEDGRGTVLSSSSADVPGLGSDRLAIPADGVTAATLNYCAADPTVTQAVWNVNGVTHSEALVNGVSEITVTSDVAGAVVVTCNEATLTLQVV